MNELSISKDPKRISSILGEFNKKFSYIEYFYYTDSEGQKYDFEPNCQFEAAKQSVRIWQFKTKKIMFPNTIKKQENKVFWNLQK